MIFKAIFIIHSSRGLRVSTANKISYKINTAIYVSLHAAVIQGH